MAQVARVRNATFDRVPLHAVAVVAIALFGSSIARAQELEPRAYANAPVGLNFLIAGYTYSTGGLSTEPSLPITNAELKIHAYVLAYARTLDLWGRSGKIDVLVPYAQLSGSAEVAGEPRDRDVSGFGDPRVRVSVNFFGAPALSLQEFAAYKQDLIVGMSVLVSAPGGQYDPTRAVNIATNRWSIKPEIGVSKAFGSATLELAAAAAFYSRNDDYFGGNTREQDPVYSLQAHLSYSLGRGIWAAANWTHFRGGRTTVNGVRSNDELANSRIGATLSLPIDRYNSIKLYASSGVVTRTGTSFDTIGIAWQRRWGAGL
jgi:hypothetical protein